MFRTYSELLRFDNFEDRFEYLRLNGNVGRATFGFDRYINQKFYTSHEWKRARRDVIVRDNGCDLGVPGYEIGGTVLIHHINPMKIDDILHKNEDVFDPEYLITTTHDTHNALHYSDKNQLIKTVLSRSPNDTKLW
jgi:hypothetical protein